MRRSTSSTFKFRYVFVHFMLATVVMEASKQQLLVLQLARFIFFVFMHASV